MALGSDFQLNTRTLGYQAFPAVASDADGDFVIAWHSDQDGSYFGVFAQRFSSAGLAVGGELAVNVRTLGSQRIPFQIAKACSASRSAVSRST